MELLNRIRHLLGASPMAKESNGWAAGFVALSVPCLVAAAMTLAAGSMPAAAVAEDEKPVETKEIQVKVGDRVGMKISGDLFDKFFGLVFPGRKIEPGTQEFFIGTITGDLPDGRCQIEYTNGVDRGDQTPQLFSMTAVVPRSQVKMPPPLPKNQKIVAMIDGKTTNLNLVVIGSDDPTKNVPSDKTAVPTLLVEEIKRDYYYLELSELKGVKFKLWELQREIGE